jgi:hypothetical protein
MATFCAGHRREATCAFGAVLVVLGLGTLSVAAQTNPTDAKDSLALFAELMPVCSSPRCVNCL